MAVTSPEYPNVSSNSEGVANELPRNRVSSKYHKTDNRKWRYSDEIPNLKTGDYLQVFRDNVVSFLIVVIKYCKKCSRILIPRSDDISFERNTVSGFIVFEF